MEPLQPEKQTGPRQKSPESTESPSDSVPQFSSLKKTRDLPNLTECHGCGFKVDVCSGKNALRTLYSEWRVVLLCSKCFSSVESSRICSYCFSGTSSESFRCIQCRHSVHKSCFLKYKNTAPWSYACVGSEFSVCVDCWIPKQVADSRSRRKREDSGTLKKKGRVLGGGNFVGSMEGVVKDANRDVEKKVEAAARAREEAAEKAAVARKAVEIANNALSLVANRKESSRKMEAVKFFGGSVAALKLQPHANNLPMTSKSCLLNTRYLDTPKRRTSSAVSSFKTSNLSNASGCDNHKVSYDNKLYRDSHKSLCEPSTSAGSLDNDSSTDLDRLCMGKIDMKTCSNDGERTAEFDAQEIGEELMKEGEGSCSDRLINYGGEDSGLELDRKHADSALHGEDKYNGQPDRYFVKYKRRNSRLKPNQDSQPKTLYDKINHKSQDSAVEVPFSCSGELRTISDASFELFHATLQASACESGYFREPSYSGEDSGLELDRKQADSTLHGEDKCNGQPDRYFLKYKKRNCRLKPNQDSQPKTLYDKINHKNQDSAVGVPFSCSGELRTISEASYQSFPAPLQASACESGCLREPSYSGEDSGLEPDRKQADSSLHGEDKCNGQPDRYFVKYKKRNRRLKPNQDSQPKIPNDNICLESQDSAVRVPFSCSGELRTISEASFQSFHAPLQASACESGSFREPS